MPDRRQILKAGLAGSALPAAVFASAARAAGPLKVQRAVYDERFDEARGFAREAAARGWPLRPIRGDVTDVWFHDLDLLWKSEPASVAGLTAPSALFCLERLSWDAGLRVAHRAEVPGAGLVAWLIAPRRRAPA